jgi:cellulose synthase/poly-beta-1,6-N-acetylglucosamine synthase-like glycosyltransferase
MEEMILIAYFVSLVILFTFGSHGFIMIYYHYKYRDKKNHPVAPLEVFPTVTIQLPIYNEVYVVKRIIQATCDIEYPKDKLEIQILDDSTDETIGLVDDLIEEYSKKGIDIVHVCRSDRKGYKAGALREGLRTAKGEYIAIFDADFVPHKDFLVKTIPHFLTDPRIGMVQTRWEHLNGTYSLLTRAQALALDGHFVIEQSVRNKAGLFMNFNGTGGVWRKSCIEDSGNWQDDTLTEDLDLSYRAQLKGWKFKYLNDVTSPAELPSEINALKTQQFRWTKGAIETAKKMLPSVWKARIPLRVKLLATFHLTNNLVFPFILLAGILNVPLIIIKNGGRHNSYFVVMSVFVLAFVGSFLFYFYSQKDIHNDWKRRVFLFPLFMAGSMGFSLLNTKAVFEAIFKKKSEFSRTPKYQIVGKGDSWINKKYVPKKANLTVAIEMILAVYCLFGVGLAVYFMEIAAVPFQLMFFLGFSFVSFLSIKHATLVR